MDFNSKNRSSKLEDGAYLLSRILQRLEQQLYKVIIKNRIKLLLVHVRLYVDRRPRLKQNFLFLVSFFPSLKRRLVSIKLAGISSSSSYSVVPTELAELTPKARIIYYELKHLIKCQKDNSKDV